MGPTSLLRPGRYRRHQWLAIAIGLAVLGDISLPWLAAAYHLERAGHELAAETLFKEQVRDIEHELQRALAWQPANAQAYRLLARVYDLQGNRSAAAEALGHYAELRPANPIGYWELSQACEQLDASLLAGIPTQPCGLDEKSRQETLVRLWRAAGYSAADFIRGGDELQKAKDWDQAEAYYHRALLLDPQATVAWYDLGELYLSRGQPEAALAAYGQVGNSELEPLLAAPAHARRGTILADARRWADAAAELAQAVALVPDEGRYQLDYGWYLYKTGQNLDRARAALTAAADLMPQSPWPHLRLAELAEAEKNYDEMLAQSQQAAELQPTLFWSWMFQGWAFANLEQEEKAEQTFRRAMELSPDQAVAHVALGLVLEQMGRVAEAVPEYEQAVRLMPDSIEYNVDLAQAYLATGETSQAIQTYRRVLELDPENKVAIQALEDLGNE